jgi:HEAT repeat protein
MTLSTLHLARPLPALLLLALPSCGPSIRPDFNSAEPAARNAAIIEAARANDQSRIPDLIRMLRSDDPATRLLASETLETMTGQTMGYDPEGPEHERQVAIDRWRDWDRIRASQSSIR